MAHLTPYVFIAYDHDDIDEAVKIRDLLSAAGIEVWWDRLIRDGDVVDALQAAIRTSSCVVPLWTQNSISSAWVRDEFRFAQEAGRPICSVRLQQISAPLGSGQVKSYDLYPWRGKRTPHLRELIDALRSIIKDATSNLAPTLTTESGKELLFPCFARSVSSHETFLRPDIAVQVLQILNTDVALVSAYDIAKDKTRRLALNTNRLRKSGTILFLDSGNYEASRKNDRKWKEKQFRNIVERIEADLIFAFDNVNAPSDERLLVKNTVRSYNRLARTIRSTGIPVLHLPRGRDGTYKSDRAAVLAAEIIRQTDVRLIAIPERELGPGLFSRAKTVWSIRQRLESIPGPRRFLHLLGTGNPLSIAVFAAVGADSFDGLEWCRTAADADSMFLFHSQQFDFFRHQASNASQPAVRELARDDSVNYNVRIALHNLSVFATWIRTVNHASSNRVLDRLLTGMLPKPAFDQLVSYVPEAFARN